MTPVLLIYTNYIANLLTKEENPTHLLADDTSSFISRDTPDQFNMAPMKIVLIDLSDLFEWC